MNCQHRFHAPPPRILLGHEAGLGPHVPAGRQQLRHGQGESSRTRWHGHSPSMPNQFGGSTVGGHHNRRATSERLQGGEPEAFARTGSDGDISTREK